MAGANMPDFARFDDIAAAEAATPVTFSGLPNYIDALLNQNQNLYWNNGNFGAAVTVTYNFPNWYNPSVEGPAYNFTAAEMNYARQAFALWADVANINFVEVSAGGAANIEIRKVYQDPGVAGGTWYPHTIYNGVDVGGSIYLDPAYSPTAPGTYGFLTVLHEIGHALGLKHPGNYNAGGGGTEGPYLPAGQDNYLYSIMSYYSAPGMSGINPLTPMLDDIAAIQFVYGARQSHTGNDSYTFSTSTQIRAIWDAGGSDAIDATNQTYGCWINLTPGSFSSIGTSGLQLNNIAIAYNCIIESAYGGSGADHIVGNDYDNLLMGNGGNDTIQAGFGNDHLWGGAGADFLDGGPGFNAARYDDSPSGLTADLAASGLGTGYAANDTYFNIQALYGSNYGDILRGDGGGNLISGNGGDDVIMGRAGADMLFGDAGNDQLYGGAGADYLDGGAGVDVARYDDADSAVIVDLLYQSGNSGAAAGDTLVSIEGVYGSSFGDIISGDNLGNLLYGGDGDDILFGRGGSDYLSGGNGTDSIFAGPGYDTLDGGGGYDYARYDYAPGAVLADLLSPAGNLGEAFGHTYISIEGLVGSEYSDMLLGDDSGNVIYGHGGDDALMGRGGNDYLYGDEGSDSLFGGPGGDVMDGGGGLDYARYDYAATGVLVDMLKPGTNTGEAAGDAYFYIEGLVGSAYADTLRGDDAGNIIFGLGGADTLIGYAGNDYLSGGDGTDVFDGGAGADTLVGGAGDDIFVFRRSEANGDTITDFSGNGGLAGDRIQFVGYGAGAQFLQIDATHWVIISGDNLTHDVITFANGASVHPTDYLFS